MGMRCLAPETERQCRNAASSQKTTDMRPHSRVALLHFIFFVVFLFFLFLDTKKDKVQIHNMT